MRQHKLTNDEWMTLAPLLPPEKSPIGKTNLPHRAVLNSIFRRNQTGALWRDLSERYGKWQALYSRFRRWQLAGV